MEGPPVTRKPCCVCEEEGGKHCTLCKSRHYCSKACQLVDWKERGHKAQCKQLAADFQDRLLDSLFPEKPGLKKAGSTAAAEDVRADAAPRAPAVGSDKAEDVQASSLSDRPAWSGNCAICLDRLPLGTGSTFYECCCRGMCTACSGKCREYDVRCPLCRTPHTKSHSEWLRRVQKHADAGNADAQSVLGNAYRDGTMGLKKSFKKARALFELAAVQGHALAQVELGLCYKRGEGVKVNYKTAAQWYRLAADQGFYAAQFNLGAAFDQGQGVPQSDVEAVEWYRLAAAQGHPVALYNLGACYANGQGVPGDGHEALRLYKLAAAKGCAEAKAAVGNLEQALAQARWFDVPK